MKNLAIAAGIAVCIAMSFAAATASPLRQSAAEMIDAKQQTSQTTQTSTTAHAANQAHDVDFRGKRQSSGRRGHHVRSKQGNCTSEMNQNCTPAAHIVSMGQQWSDTTTDNTAQDLYSTRWICKEEDAFADCGMNFIYNDQKLYVPVCGVYEVYSQVFFQSDALDVSAVVHHKVEIIRNCSHSGDNTAEFKSYAGLTPVSVGKATTTNLATVKMCAGGSVSVVIPAEGNTCCAYGGKSSTYFSARLISQVGCESIE